MAKPKKVVQSDGTSYWEVRLREGGRSSKAFKRRFLSLKEAQEFLEDLKDQRRKMEQGFVDTGTFQGTTFQREAENWLEDLRLRSSAGHFARCQGMLEDFNQSYGKLEPNRITLEFLSALQKRLKERPSHKGEKWKNGTVNLYIGCICAVLNFSARQRRIPFSPVTGFRKLPKNSPEMLFWDEREATAFLKWADERYSDYDNGSRRRARKHFIIYLLALNTGMRAGELWGLRPQDFFFGEEGGGDTIFVRRQFTLLTRQIAPLKGELKSDRDKSRHVPCPPELRKELEALVAFNKTSTHEPVFQSVNGRPIHHDSFCDRFHRDVQRWGGRRIRFHDLRHTAATLMLAKGVDVKTVKEILGHEDIHTTMKYVHLVGDRIKQVSRSFSIRPS